MNSRTLRLMLLTGVLAVTVHAQGQYPGDQGPGPDQGAYQGPAPDQDGSGEPEDTPGRGVARISLLNGEVGVRRGDSGENVAAAPNAPLMAGDRIVTGPASRAEVQFDFGNLIRIGQNSEVRMGELENRRYLIQIAHGVTTFRVLRDYQSDVEISTPSVSVRPRGRGVYRVTVLDDGTSEITVRAGEAEIFTPRGSEPLRPGRTLLARGSASDPEFQDVGQLPYDDWDRWNQQRDQDLERAAADNYRYVSPDIYGAEDLEGNGRWVQTPDYGWAWSPQVAPGWAPYQNGRWVWTDFYGWTWVSYDPWGWAPYHYGRWFNAPGFGWCWWPGAVRSHYYWRPGLVAFFGFGHGGAGFGFGHVGWVPLAPHEPFHAWYGNRFYHGYRSGFVNDVRIVNNINISNNYRNARVANGITGVPADGFGRGARFTSFHPDQIGQVGLVRGQLPMAPDRASLRWSDRQSNLPSARSADERFFNSRGNARADRVPFAQQQRAMDPVARRTFGDSSVRGSSASPTFGRGDSPASSGAWRRFGSPAPQGSAPVENSFRRSAPEVSAPGTNRQADSGGWRRFGSPNAAPNYGGPRQSNSESQAAPRQSFRQNETFGRDSQPAYQRPAPEVRQPAPRYEAPRNENSYRGGQPSYQRPAPEVRQQAPRYESPRNDSSFRGGQPSYQRPAPEMRQSAPRSEAPRMERSAPSHSSAPAPSNGGGGGSRGGGGESRGGGGHSRR